MSGKFITFEGPEGGGKTTQMRLAAEHLFDKGIPHITTREPGGPPISEKIRKIILSPENSAMANRTELLLILASRAQHTEEVLLPALEAGKTILCDRYSDSTMAYQVFGNGSDFEQTSQLCNMAAHGLVPDRTYLVDIDPKVGLDRSRAAHKDTAAEGAVDRMEAKNLEFHLKVRAGFLELAEREPDRFLVLDGSKPIDENRNEIKKDLDKLLIGK